MAIYHCTVKIGSKSEGHSAGQKCAYITRTENYAKKSDECAYSASGNMPKWPKTNPQKDPAHYWKAADIYERDNGRLYREVEFALPRELSLDQQKALCHAFAERLTTLDKGEKLPFTVAIHTDKDNHNPHCHLMISERINDGIPRNASTWFKRANAKEPKSGGAVKTQDLNGKQWLEPTRKLWAELANEAMKAANPDFHERTDGIDHRSHKARGLSTIPTEHLGAACGDMMRRNKPCQRGHQIAAINRTARAGNDFRRQYPEPHSRLGRMVIGSFRAASAKHFGGTRPDGQPKTMKDILRDIDRLIKELMRTSREIAENEIRIAQAQLTRIEAETQALRAANHAASMAGMETFFASYDAAKPLELPEAKPNEQPKPRAYRQAIDFEQAIQNQPFIHQAFHACESDENAQAYEGVLFALQQLPVNHPVRQHANPMLRELVKPHAIDHERRFDAAAVEFGQWFTQAMDEQQAAQLQAQNDLNKPPSMRLPWKHRHLRYVPNFTKRE